MRHEAWMEEDERKTVKTHELKTWPEFFKLVWSGQKPFELRFDDRGFRAGDMLRLREYVQRDDRYTGRQIDVKITSVISGFPGLEPDYVIMGFNPATMTLSN